LVDAADTADNVCLELTTLLWSMLLILLITSV